MAKKAKLLIGELGGIVVDEHMRTNDPNIYAVGDVIEVNDFVRWEESFGTACSLLIDRDVLLLIIFWRKSVYKKLKVQVFVKYLSRLLA